MGQRINVLVDRLWQDQNEHVTLVEVGAYSRYDFDRSGEELRFRSLFNEVVLSFDIERNKCAGNFFVVVTTRVAT